MIYVYGVYWEMLHSSLKSHAYRVHLSAFNTYVLTYPAHIYKRSSRRDMSHLTFACQMGIPVLEWLERQDRPGRGSWVIGPPGRHLVHDNGSPILVRAWASRPDCCIGSDWVFHGSVQDKWLFHPNAKSGFDWEMTRTRRSRDNITVRQGFIFIESFASRTHCSVEIKPCPELRFSFF